MELIINAVLLIAVAIVMVFRVDRVSFLGRLADKRPTPIAQIVDGTVVRIVGIVVTPIPLIIDDGTGCAIVDLDPSIGDKGLFRAGGFSAGARITVLGPAILDPDPEATCERGYRDDLPRRVRIAGSRRIPLCLTDDLRGVARRT